MKDDDVLLEKFKLVKKGLDTLKDPRLKDVPFTIKIKIRS